MIKKRLEEIQSKIKENCISLEDIAEITSESFLSQSKHFNELKQSVKNIETSLQQIQQNIEKITNPIFQIIDEEEDDETKE